MTGHLEARSPAVAPPGGEVLPSEPGEPTGETPEVRGGGAPTAPSCLVKGRLGAVWPVLAVVAWFGALCAVFTRTAPFTCTRSAAGGVCVTAAQSFDLKDILGLTVEAATERHVSTTELDGVVTHGRPESVAGQELVLSTRRGRFSVGDSFTEGDAASLEALVRGFDAFLRGGAGRFPDFRYYRGHDAVTLALLVLGVAAARRGWRGRVDGYFAVDSSRGLLLVVTRSRSGAATSPLQFPLSPPLEVTTCEAGPGSTSLCIVAGGVTTPIMRVPSGMAARSLRVAQVQSVIRGALEGKRG